MDSDMITSGSPQVPESSDSWQKPEVPEKEETQTLNNLNQTNHNEHIPDNAVICNTEVNNTAIEPETEIDPRMDNMTNDKNNTSNIAQAFKTEYPDDYGQLSETGTSSQEEAQLMFKDTMGLHNPLQTVYRGGRGHDSDSSSVSSDSSVSSPICSEDEDETRQKRVKSKKPQGDEEFGVNSDEETKATEDAIETLLPIEDLNIEAPRNVEIQTLGKVSKIIGSLVVVASDREKPAIQMDSFLFLESRKALGQIYEIFGPVLSPFYSVRFNSQAEIKQRQIEPGDVVYFAPKVDIFTHYVFIEELKRHKGSDASWEDNQEPPDKCVEFSDDEDEKKFRAYMKAKNRNRPPIEEGPPTGRHELHPERKKKRKKRVRGHDNSATNPPDPALPHVPSQSQSQRPASLPWSNTAQDPSHWTDGQYGFHGNRGPVGRHYMRPPTFYRPPYPQHQQQHGGYSQSWSSDTVWYGPPGPPAGIRHQPPQPPGFSGSGADWTQPMSEHTPQPTVHRSQGPTAPTHDLTTPLSQSQPPKPKLIDMRFVQKKD